MGVTQGAGLSLHWFRDNFAAQGVEAGAQLGRDPYDLLMGEAARAEPVFEGLMLLATYLMGERMQHLDAKARGVFPV